MSISDTNVENILKLQPDDPELENILDEIAEAYGAYLIETDETRQEDYMEFIEDRIDSYQFVAHLEKDGGEYDEW